ncbi:MAG: gamma-glutamylcyclotransferase [Sphingobacteriales bacterium]
MMNNKLFVYGTLLDDDNKYGIYLRDNSKFFASANLEGILYDIGEYPGAILRPGGADSIHGIILEMDDPSTILALLDMYEGFGEDQPQPNEFIRVLTEANTDKGPVNCWLYTYNLPAEGLLPIENGKYIK